MPPHSSLGVRILPERARPCRRRGFCVRARRQSVPVRQRALTGPADAVRILRGFAARGGYTLGVL